MEKSCETVRISASRVKKQLAAIQELSAEIPKKTIESQNPQGQSELKESPLLETRKKAADDSDQAKDDKELAHLICQAVCENVDPSRALCSNDST